MEEISFLTNFIKVDRMHLTCGILTDLIFQVKYIKRHGFLLLMSQFQFHRVFSGTLVRLTNLVKDQSKYIEIKSSQPLSYSKNCQNGRMQKGRTRNIGSLNSTLKSTEQLC
jgi:hypothetical protein